MQIGWAADGVVGVPRSAAAGGEAAVAAAAAGGFSCDPLDGTGCGDHPRSWAFDGLRQRRWNVSSSTYGGRWRMGDVLGCLHNLDAMEVSLNSEASSTSTP